MSRTLGVDVGGTKVLAVVVDREGEVVGERRAPTPRSGPDLVDLVVDLVVDADADAVGMGVPGLIDKGGVLRVGPNLPGIVEFGLGAALRDRLPPAMPLALDNDATAAAWAESRVGASVGASDSVLVTLGTGIGGGQVAGGRLLRGANGFAGEIGHMVVDPDGPPCPCGRRGCWERFGSGNGLGRLAREAAEAGRLASVVEAAGGDTDAVRGEHVTTAAAGGDTEALAVLDRFGWWVALGVANLVALADPSVVVLGGGLVEAGDLLLEPVRRHYGELVVAADHRPPVRIEPALLGEHAGAVGAALLAQGQG